jgi:hypothetical protein
MCRRLQTVGPVEMPETQIRAPLTFYNGDREKMDEEQKHKGKYE